MNSKNFNDKSQQAKALKSVGLDKFYIPGFVDKMFAGLLKNDQADKENAEKERAKKWNRLARRDRAQVTLTHSNSMPEIKVDRSNSPVVYR